MLAKKLTRSPKKSHISNRVRLFMEKQKHLLQHNYNKIIVLLQWCCNYEGEPSEEGQERLKSTS